eukprot:jgi/Bigna1/90960/estExt_fgenesh1_pg.C_840015
MGNKFSKDPQEIYKEIKKCKGDRQKLAKKLFVALDDDRSGYLTIREIVDQFEGYSKSHHSIDYQTIFDNYDTNNDGIISETEFIEFYIEANRHGKTAWLLLTRNLADGCIIVSMQIIFRTIVAKSTDADFIYDVELKGKNLRSSVNVLFDAMDDDETGTIDAREFQSHLSHHHQQQQQHGGGIRLLECKKQTNLKPYGEPTMRISKINGKEEEEEEEDEEEAELIGVKPEKAKRSLAVLIAKFRSVYARVQRKEKKRGEVTKVLERLDTEYKLKNEEEQKALREKAAVETRIENEQRKKEMAAGKARRRVQKRRIEIEERNQAKDEQQTTQENKQLQEKKQLQENQQEAGEEEGRGRGIFADRRHPKEHQKEHRKKHHRKHKNKPSHGPTLHELERSIDDLQLDEMIDVSEVVQSQKQKRGMCSGYRGAACVMS